MNEKSMKVDDVGVQRPWLSIIVPIYNAERYLGDCLDSILEQTFTDFEVLLIDDGSTDNSPNICKKYSNNDSRFHYIRKENGGAYQSRIFGAERALGEYITFCDADDYYVSKNVFSLLHEELLNSDCMAIQFGYIKKYNHLWRKVSSVNGKMDIGMDDFYSFEYPKLLCSFWNDSHLTINVWNKVYHRELLLNLPSSASAERIFWGDDLILNLFLLSSCNSFRIIPNTLYCYRELSGDTNVFSRNTMKDLDNVKKYQIMFLERYQGDSKDSIKNTLFSEMAGWFFIYVKQALNYFKETELVEFIEEILGYPRFVLAGEYYVDKIDDDWEGANLLRKGDAKEYIRRAKESQCKRSIKESIKNILRKIYISI